MKLFPIMESRIFRAIPWEMFDGLDEWAQRNHNQSLEHLAGRGGLDPAEAVAVLDSKPYLERWPGPISTAVQDEAEASLLEKVVRHMITIRPPKTNETTPNPS